MWSRPSGKTWTTHSRGQPSPDRQSDRQGEDLQKLLWLHLLESQRPLSNSLNPVVLTYKYNILQNLNTQPTLTLNIVADENCDINWDCAVEAYRERCEGELGYGPFNKSVSLHLSLLPYSPTSAQRSNEIFWKANLNAVYRRVPCAYLLISTRRANSTDQLHGQTSGGIVHLDGTHFKFV